MYLLNYKVLSLVVGAMIIVTTSIGLAEEPAQDVEVSIIDVEWNEVVSETGAIAVSGISIDVRNDADAFRNYRICAQLTSITTVSSDVACNETGILSPNGQAGDTKDGLLIDFVHQLNVADLDEISFEVTKILS